MTVLKMCKIASKKDLVKDELLLSLYEADIGNPSGAGFYKYHKTCCTTNVLYELSVNVPINPVVQANVRLP